MRTLLLTLAIAGAPLVARAEEARDRFIVGGSGALGLGAHAEAHAGWMVDPEAALLAAGVLGEPFTDEGNGYKLALVGTRLWFAGPVYLDLRGGFARAHHAECTSGGDPCTEDGFGFYAGLGAELISSPRFAIALHAELAGGAGSGTLAGGIGIDFF